MRTSLSLFMLTAMAMAVPAAAQPQHYVATNLTGALRVQVRTPVDNVDMSTPITSGRIEIQAGPFIGNPNVGKHFVLARVSLHFADMVVVTRSFGNEAVRFSSVGAYTTTALTWWGLEAQPGVPGVYLIDIPVGESRFTGHPEFILGARVNSAAVAEKFEIPNGIIHATEESTQSIIGVIDLNAQTFHLTAVFEKEEFFGIGGRRKFTVALQGLLAELPRARGKR